MSYSIKNLREVQDSAPQHGLGDTQEARFAHAELGAEKTGLSYHMVKPGKRQGFAHRHQEAEEIYVILRGHGRVKLGDEFKELGPMDAVRVAPHVARAFEAGPDGLELLAFGARHEGDGEIIGGDEFWRG